MRISVYVPDYLMVSVLDRDTSSGKLNVSKIVQEALRLWIQAHPLPPPEVDPLGRY